jgi:hypothetical protein
MLSLALGCYNVSFRSAVVVSLSSLHLASWGDSCPDLGTNLQGQEILRKWWRTEDFDRGLARSLDAANLYRGCFVALIGFNQPLPVRQTRSFKGAQTSSDEQGERVNCSSQGPF